MPDKDRKDEKLFEKLADEMEGILAWAVKGCLDWQQHGLAEPDEVTEATRQYQQDSDILEHFLKDTVVSDPTSNEVRARDFCERYKKYSGEEISEKNFKKRMESKGYAQGENSHGKYWVGLRFRDSV